MKTKEEEEELEEWYLARMIQLEDGNKNDNDNEYLHVEIDRTITELLKEAGFTKIASKYEELSIHFWYS